MSLIDMAQTFDWDIDGSAGHTLQGSGSTVTGIMRKSEKMTIKMATGI